MFSFLHYNSKYSDAQENDGFQDEVETVTRNGVTKPTFHGFLQGFSRKNYTNCARFKGGAVFGGSYRY